MGAVIGHLLLGYSLSIMSLFGVVALTGVVVNDSLIFIDFALQAAYRWKDGKLDENPQVLGFCELLEIAEGESIKKSDIAGKLGFKGKTAWKDNKDRILFWLDPFFDAGTRELIRKKK